MRNIIKELRKELKKNTDEHTKISAQRFFKEEVNVYGIKTAIVRKISTKYFKEINQFNKNDIYKLSEELFSSGIIEESFVACNWTYSLRKKYEDADFILFEKWIDKYVNNWATCDTFCNHSIGAFIVMFPEYIPELKNWTQSKNMWMRRAAAVSLVVPGRKGQFLSEAFEIADLLMSDKEDLVQKGFGWLLKEESRVNQKEVYNYLISKKRVMPRTAYRYALEKMPVDMRKEAMKK